ncbi:MAG: hypothetical protein JO303_03075, partial [Caulobacteraceae bacterium]|nr:hypothetical protein [Caulobacteraceae bacterium]
MTQAPHRSSSPAAPRQAEFRVGRTGPALDSTEALLSEGGDCRLALDPVSGRSRYGCAVRPAGGAPQFSSATASTISPAGFAAADRLRERLAALDGREPRAATYARELDRVRGELLGLCGLAGPPGLEVVFAASGTDAHLIAAELFAGPSAA